MHKYLNKATDIPFSKIYLDPNNPRIAPEERPGYDDPAMLFPEAVQVPLTEKLDTFAEVDALEPAIVSQGWMPIDPILVWEHPEQPGHFIVIEGNTRTVVLRRVRNTLSQEKAHLDKMEKRKGKYDKQDILEQRRVVAQLQQIVDDTEALNVYSVKAASASELEEVLPRLHGVRHISHAQPWSPYGTNLYLLSRYRQLFETQYGEGNELKIEDKIVKALAGSVSLKATKARQKIQAAAAFSHFKKNYEHKLPSGEKFADRDQYFFELILQNEYPRKELGFDKADLHLSPEMEDVLFKWAFAEPRRIGDNPNKFYEAENIRLWQTMRKYDVLKGTTFSEQFAVEDPESAPAMTKLEAEYLQHKAQVSPLDTISSLLKSLKNLKVETLQSQASHLDPMIKEMIKQGQMYLKLLEAVGAKV
jgi:hypothetical protein